MKRSPMPPRKTSMRKRYVPPPVAPLKPITLRRDDGKARLVVPVPKGNPLQHQGYMNLVRGMACKHCHRPPRSEFCHSDEGKGTGIKSDCRLGWPGCKACHTLIGTDRIYPKAERREIEARFSRETRAEIRAAGLWPKRLPLWPADLQEMST